MQDWPAWEKPATDMAFAALAQSPSSSMITGALLPNSNPTFFLGALARMLQPTSGDPVNEIMAMSSCVTMPSPTSPDGPGSTQSQPSGRPASAITAANRTADNGVWLAGFSTTAHPAASPGATLWPTKLSRKLNGLMAPTTPIGT